jgi:hypothetical protein
VRIYMCIDRDRLVHVTSLNSGRQTDIRHFLSASSVRKPIANSKGLTRIGNEGLRDEWSHAERTQLVRFQLEVSENGRLDIPMRTS